MLLYFVRHGQTNDNLLSPNRNLASYAPLNKTGKIQAKKAASFLAAQVPKPNFIASSHWERAHQTAQIIAKELEIDIKVDNELGEVEYGDWSKKTIIEALEVWKPLTKDEIVDFRLSPSVESWRDMAERMTRAVKELQKDQAGPMVLVSHGAPIRFAIANLLDTNSQTWHTIHSHYDNGSVSCLEYKNNKWHALFLNKT